MVPFFVRALKAVTWSKVLFWNMFSICSFLAFGLKM